jgi:two-component system OmpR family response regulator
MSIHILIIEDEEKIARLLEMELTHEGYCVELAASGKVGLDKALSREWSVILLDIMLPELSGLGVLRRLRQTDTITPVIVLTARSTIPDKVGGLDLGANDYMTKPFKIEELLARIRACIRNRKPSGNEESNESSPFLVVGDLRLNPRTREVFREQAPIELTRKEYELLLYLIEHHDQVLSRENIINQVWGYDFIGDTNIVDVYIRYLRKKIDYPFHTQLIQTFRGIGYSIKEPNHEP